MELNTHHSGCLAGSLQDHAAQGIPTDIKHVNRSKILCIFSTTPFKHYICDRPRVNRHASEYNGATGSRHARRGRAVHSLATIRRSTPARRRRETSGAVAASTIAEALLALSLAARGVRERADDRRRLAAIRVRRMDVTGHPQLSADGRYLPQQAQPEERQASHSSQAHAQHHRTRGRASNTHGQPVRQGKSVGAITGYAADDKSGEHHHTEQSEFMARQTSKRDKDSQLVLH